MSRKKYPRFVVNLVKASAYKIYKLAQKATVPPLDKYDFQTIDLIKKILPANANCIDIGAHKGDILKQIIKQCPKGKHFAIEPIPWLYNDLQKFWGNKATVLNIALSNQKGEAEFNVFRDRPAVSGLKQREFAGENYKVEKIKVKLQMLDHVIPEDLPIHLIKIDVEGAELQVLEGATTILKKHKPVVIFEFGLGGSDLYDTTPEKMYDHLHSCGLSLSILEYYLQEKPPFSRDEFIGQYEKGYNYFFVAYHAG